MDFRDLTYVQEIARQQTISKAAEVLHMTQPSLSIFLKKLEEETGTPLFERVNKKMYPTYAGERYLRYAERTLREGSGLMRELESISKSKTGHISICSTPTRTKYIFPELLTAFHEKYPDFLIEVKEAPIDGMMQMMDEHTLDFAFFTLHEQDRLDKRYSFHHLSWEEVVLCAPSSRNYAAMAVEREGFSYPWIELSRLADELFLIVPERWRAGRCAARCFEQIGISPRTIVFPIVELAVASSSCGLGISFCPDIMIRRGLFAQTPDYFSVGENPNRIEFVLAHRRNFPMTQAAGDFIRMAQDLMRG